MRTRCPRRAPSPPPRSLHLEVGEDADRPLQRGPVRLLRRATSSWPAQAGTPAPRPTLLRHAGARAATTPVHLAQPADDGPHELARAARCASSCSASSSAPRGRRPAPRRPGPRRRARCRARRAARRRRPALCAGGARAPSFSISRDEPLLARCRPAPRAPGRLAGRARDPARARAPTHHFGSSHGFGAAYSRTSPPAFLTALTSCFGRLAARHQHQHRVRRQLGQRLLERARARRPSRRPRHRPAGSGCRSRR